MLKIENVEVNGFEAAIKRVSHPSDSWEKSDSRWCSPGACNHKIVGTKPCIECDKYCEDFSLPIEGNEYCIGKNDMALMQKLFKGGTENRKFMRFITVTMDVTAPLYWWEEFDTYKIGTVANSCSTMHTIHKKEFSLDDFSCEDLHGAEAQRAMVSMVNALNRSREEYLEKNDKAYWRNMIQLLPSSYNQRRTILLNYEVAANILRQRSNHKLSEWHTFCDELRKLPYLKEIIGDV